jgi:hypothetical protein
MVCNRKSGRIIRVGALHPLHLVFAIEDRYLQVGPTLKHILSVAERASIKKSVADEIIGRVKEAVDKWPEYAKAAQLAEKRMHEIDYLLNNPDRLRRMKSR